MTIQNFIKKKMSNIEHKVGEKILFLKMNATIRYIGPFHEKPGLWIGIEVDVPKGKNNGTIKGHKYFECEPNHGFFLQYETFVKALGVTPKPSTKNLPTDQKLSPSKSNSDFASIPIHPHKISVSTSMAGFDQVVEVEDNSSPLAQPKTAENSSPLAQPQTTENSSPLVPSKAVENPSPLIPQNEPETPQQTQQPQPKLQPVNQSQQKQPTTQSQQKQQSLSQQDSDSSSQNIPLAKSQISSSLSSPSLLSKQNVGSQPKTQPKTSRTSTQTASTNIDETTPTPSVTSASASISTTNSPRTTDVDAIIASLEKKCQDDYQKIRNDAKKYKDVQAKIAEKDKNFKAEVEKKKNELNEKIVRMQLKYLPEQLKLEEDLLKYAKNEKIAKKKSMKKGTHQSIEVLQQINEEHIKFENSYRELINKQSMKFDSKKNKLNLLNAKLKNQYELSDEQQKTIDELQQTISAYDKELTEKLPVSKEATDLKIKIAAQQSALEKCEKVTNYYTIDCNVANFLLKKIEPLFAPVVPATAVIFRLIEKANALLDTSLSIIPLEDVDKSTLEDILHICDTAIMALGWSDTTTTSEFTTFIHELSEFESNVDNEVIPTIETDHILKLLQSITPLPLNLAISSHLIRAIMYRTKSADTRDELKDFAKQFSRIFHPSQMLKNREECEKFCLSLRAELRKPEKNDKTFSVMKYLTQLQSFLSFQTKDEENTKNVNPNQPYSLPYNLVQKFKLIATQEILLANSEAEKKAIEKEEEGLPEMRRSVADLESNYDQLVRYNNQLSQLKNDLPSKIEKMKNEINEAEELIKEIEADIKKDE